MDAERVGFAKTNESPLLDSLRQNKFLLLLDRANINDNITKLPPAPAAPAVDTRAVLVFPLFHRYLLSKRAVKRCI